MQIRASNNLIQVNPHQFAALLARNYCEVVVGALNGANAIMTSRLLASLMQEFAPQWVPVEGYHSDPIASLAPATFTHTNQEVPLCRAFVDLAKHSGFVHTVRPVALRELETPMSDRTGVVMVIDMPTGYADTTKYTFDLFIQLDGFTYVTGVAQIREKTDPITLMTSPIARRDISRYLSRPLADDTRESSLNLWLDVNYRFLERYNKCFNDSLEEHVEKLPQIEDFREGAMRAAVLEANQLTPIAQMVYDRPKIRPTCKPRIGTDAEHALVSIKSVGELTFTPIPERYNDLPLKHVRVAEDAEVEGEYLTYLGFAMPSGGVEEQVVVSGTNFKAIYNVATMLAEATILAISFGPGLIDRHFGQ